MTRFYRLSVAAAFVAMAAPLTGQMPAVRAVSNATSVPASAPPTLDSAITQLQTFLAKYPTSPLRPNALFELGELLVDRADQVFAASQRAPTGAAGDTTRGAQAAIKPNYGDAIARYEELVQRYPNFDRIDAAEYTLGTLYNIDQRYADAARMFGRVATVDSSRFRPEALFRLGDATFEMASREKGAPRRALFARAADAYEKATAVAPAQGDIYFLSLYKLGWSYYNQANQASQAEYKKAVDIFGRLVAAYDKLTPEQQSRLGLRSEAIEYMAVAFTQVGGSDAANQYFATHGGTEYKLPILRRVAQSLRDQGDFASAVRSYRTVLTEAPADSSALNAQREIIDIYQNRMLEADSAQSARLRLVREFAPGSAWAQANPGLADTAAAAREVALRQSGAYLLASAQAGSRQRFGEAAQLYEEYLNEFASSDSAQIVNRYYAEALFGQGDYAKAGAAFAHTAYAYKGRDSSLAQDAGRNAIVASDSALMRNKTDRAAQDSLFSAVNQFVAAFPNTDVAKKALIEEGRRASETQRWDVMAQTFRTYAERYPNDPYTPTAQKLIGDALYRGGQYAEAQQQWEKAQATAVAGGRRALADSIAATRTTAAASFADTLIKGGEYKRAAEEVYVAYADKNPNAAKAPDALRNAIEAYMSADSVARAKSDGGSSTADRQRAIELSNRLVSTYPNYRYRLQYQALAARLLADMGQHDQAVQAYRQLIAQNPGWSGRADAMARVAVMLDSLGNKKEAAAAYADFANAYPGDSRAAGALYNAAVTYVEAGDTTAAANSYGQFARRFPRDQRAAQAQAQRVALLTAKGDTAAAAQALASACANPTPEFRGQCSAKNAERYFRIGLATFNEYQPLKLTIATARQLTAAGVQRASAQKQALLRRLTAEFEQSIRQGNPQYIAASTYYVGLAQWEYGNFVKNVQLPQGLTDQQQTAAQQGAAQQAQQYYDAAKKTWQELVDKAQSTPEIANDAKAAAWIQRARDALAGNVASPTGDTGL